MGICIFGNNIQSKCVNCYNKISFYLTYNNITQDEYSLFKFKFILKFLIKMMNIF